MKTSVTIHVGEALDALRGLPDASVHCCVTSPPYWNLRDYGVEGQLGLEKTPEEYVARVVRIFAEVRRVLRADGTCWVNLGDSYAAGRKGGGGSYMAERGDGSWKPAASTRGFRSAPEGLKPKDLIGIPWMVAFALRADGWTLRADVVWAKSNPMPESVLDRPSKSHEYVFLLSKSESYFYDADAIREPHVDRRANKNGKSARRGQAAMKPTGKDDSPGRWSHDAGRNARSVWSIATQPFPEAHFATFPEELPRRCIVAGTSERGCCAACGAPWVRQVERVRTVDGVPAELPAARSTSKRTPRNTPGIGHNRFRTGIRELGWMPGCDCTSAFDTAPCVVLDPFAGSGTVGAVATGLGRSFVGVELNPEYADMARGRIHRDGAPLFTAEGR